MSKLETNTIDTVSGTTNLTIGSTNSSTVTFENGAVTGHNYPAFFVYDLHNVEQSLTGGTNTKLTPATEYYDTDNAYSSDKFTVPSGKGFKNSLKLDVTTADASPDANGLLLLGYHFEGHDLQCLKYGTSSAETITIAFYVRSNKTGTFQCNLRMVDDFHRGQLVTISSADTWEKKVITFAGNTSNAIANDNSDELRIQFFFDSVS